MGQGINQSSIFSSISIYLFSPFKRTVGYRSLLLSNPSFNMINKTKSQWLQAANQIIGINWFPSRQPYSQAPIRDVQLAKHSLNISRQCWYHCHDRALANDVNFRILQRNKAIVICETIAHERRYLWVLGLALRWVLH